ncbi:uncharacterized protein LOC114042897, partial [Vombatus ursinus]|uniref:uncharacterized protein LOC114042897 n=1 Tax=Vombatus ursinus TaxID=29139 RepID=UPI000FFD63E5
MQVCARARRVEKQTCTRVNVHAWPQSQCSRMQHTNRHAGAQDARMHGCKLASMHARAGLSGGTAEHARTGECSQVSARGRRRTGGPPPAGSPRSLLAGSPAFPGSWCPAPPPSPPRSASPAPRGEPRPPPPPRGRGGEEGEEEGGLPPPPPSLRAPRRRPHVPGPEAPRRAAPPARGRGGAPRVPAPRRHAPPRPPGTWYVPVAPRSARPGGLRRRRGGRGGGGGRGAGAGAGEPGPRAQQRAES